VFNILAQAATLNNPATRDAFFQVSRQMPNGSFAPSFGYSRLH
jgi:hypothetical protein